MLTFSRSDFIYCAQFNVIVVGICQVLEIFGNCVFPCPHTIFIKMLCIISAIIFAMDMYHTFLLHMEIKNKIIPADEQTFSFYPTTETKTIETEHEINIGELKESKKNDSFVAKSNQKN